MIYLAADHGGFELKKHLSQFLESEGISFTDLGNTELDPADDYPDFAFPAIKEVLKAPSENFAILTCRSGTGEVIFANRFHGIRAVCSWTPEHAQVSKEHNNSNVLALPADYVSKDGALQIVAAWLSAKFSEDERHIRRLQKIEDFSERKAQ